MHYLFTDASHNYRGTGYTVLAGVILDPDWKPLVEFVVRADTYHDAEKLALLHGISLARAAELKNIRCFSDCLSTVRGTEDTLKFLGEDALYFDSLSVNYIPRRYNLYANALSRVPANVVGREDGTVKQAYHGVNRAKQSFYAYYHSGYFNHSKFDKNAKYNNACAKFKSIIHELERVSIGEKVIGMPKLKYLVNTLYALFQEYHFEDVSEYKNLLQTDTIQNAVV